MQRLIDEDDAQATKECRDEVDSSAASVTTSDPASPWCDDACSVCTGNSEMLSVAPGGSREPISVDELARLWANPELNSVKGGDDSTAPTDAAEAPGPTPAPSQFFVDCSDAVGRANVSYQRVGIPSNEEAVAWAEALQAVPAAGGRTDVGAAVDLATRFCLLAYTRNCAVAAQSVLLHSRQSGLPEAIELQFHGSDDYERGAHLVAYIYRLDGSASAATPGGVGVVLAYKGSTANAEDWKHNFRFLSRKRGGERAGAMSFGRHLFQRPVRSPGGRLCDDVQCHSGFLMYKRTLDDRMRQFSKAPLRGQLARWGVPSDAPHFLSWLNSGAWSWCAVVGHSLGGAMAAIAATELGVRAGKPTLLATLGCPIPGNLGFVELQDECVLPAGGLRIHNTADPVPHLGYSACRVAAAASHGGLEVRLHRSLAFRLNTWQTHQHYTVPSTCLRECDDGTALLCLPSRSRSRIAGQARPEQPMMITFKFPGPDYRPSAIAASSHMFSLGEHFSHGAAVKGPLVRSESPSWLRACAI